MSLRWTTLFAHAVRLDVDNASFEVATRALGW